jgi:hypothetical protein
MSLPVRAKPFVTQMRRGRLPKTRRRHARVDGAERPSGRNASPSGITPSNIMSPDPEPTRGSRTEVSPGARAHTNRTANHAHAPPTNHRSNPTTRHPALDKGHPAQVSESRPTRRRAPPIRHLRVAPPRRPGHRRHGRRQSPPFIWRGFVESAAVAHPAPRIISREVSWPNPAGPSFSPKPRACYHTC